MLSWEECPEAAGPQSEGVLYGKKYGDPGMPTIGKPPKIMSDEARDRERAAAAETYERRLRVERAALDISVNALEAGKLTDELMQAASAAARAAAP